MHYIGEHMLRILIMGILVSSNALAFQCKDLKFNQAKNAVVELKKYSDTKDIFVVDEFCEACMDSYPRPILVENISFKREANHYHVILNNKVVDISYLYVEGHSLSHIVGCKTVAVSEYLD